MEWFLLVLGAVLGVSADKLYDLARSRLEDRRRVAHYKALNERRELVQSLHPSIQMVQAGWDPNGFYSAGSILLHSEGAFRPSSEISELLEKHCEQWVAAGAKNNPQIGLRGYRIDRVSDDPLDEREGTAHRLILRGHAYSYFEFLASHRLLLEGDERERAKLAPLALDAGPATPAISLPTPVSVGLSLIADGGDVLVLTRRAKTESHAGSWAGGLVFNAVGEGAAPRDLASAGHDAHTMSPEVTATRGLHEEVGFRAEDSARTSVRLHSFVFDSRLLDFKFFGVAETTLAVQEVMERWKLAPDKSEAKELFFVPVGNRGECLQLLTAMASERDEWSPEALFCTIRTLLCLERVRVEDVVECIGAQADTGSTAIRTK